MKNVKSLLIALLTSLFIYLSANLFNRLNWGFEPEGLFLNILQTILFIKSLVILICFMPSGSDLKQSVYGYLLANVLIISYHITISSALTLPFYVVVLQGIQIVGCLMLQGRLKVLSQDTLHISEKTELITERI